MLKYTSSNVMLTWAKTELALHFDRLSLALSITASDGSAPVYTHLLFDDGFALTFDDGSYVGIL